MSWVKIDNLFSGHPKVAEVGPLGAAMQVAALCYANLHATDGFISERVAKTLIALDGLARSADVPSDDGQEFITAYRLKWQDIVCDLVAAGIWEEVEGGWRIHDYHEYQESRETTLRKRQENKDRQQAWRDRERERKIATKPTPPADRNALVTHYGGVSHSERNDRVTALSHGRNAPPVPVPVPVPIPVPIPIQESDLHARAPEPGDDLGVREPTSADVSARAESVDHDQDAKKWLETTFAAFKASYPKGVPRALLAEWPAYCTDPATFDKIMAGLALWSQSRQWMADGPDFVTKPATWLAKRMYLTTPVPYVARGGAHEVDQGRAGRNGTAARRNAGDIQDPYWSENAGLIVGTLDTSGRIPPPPRGSPS